MTNSQKKRCSVTNINGKVTIDNSGGGECIVNGVDVGTKNGNSGNNVGGANAGTLNGGDLAAKIKAALQTAQAAQAAKTATAVSVHGSWCMGRVEY
jgi:hypothetical protein